MNPDIAALITQYGYIAIFIGTLIEGETVVLVAGLLAHQGYLHAPFVALAAFLGSLASDQIMYLLGRYKGQWLLAKFPRLSKGVERVAAKVRGREVPLILSFRFIYGIRNVTPVFLGSSGTKPELFIPLNAISAAVWAVAMTAAGYFAGGALAAALGRLHKYEPYIVAAILLAGLVFWLYHRKRTKP